MGTGGSDPDSGPPPSHPLPSALNRTRTTRALAAILVLRRRRILATDRPAKPPPPNEPTKPPPPDEPWWTVLAVQGFGVVDLLIECGADQTVLAAAGKPRVDLKAQIWTLLARAWQLPRLGPR